MPIGKGKYDAECTIVREQSEADAVFVIVLGGNRGSGFSVQCEERYLDAIPALLEQMAENIRDSLREEGTRR